MSTAKFGEVAAARTPTNRQSTMGSNEDKPIVNSTIDNSKKVDRALEQTADLVDDQYKKWFAKQAIRLGPDRYVGIAREAREGQQPARLFVWLLKRA